MLKQLRTSKRYTNITNRNTLRLTECRNRQQPLGFRMTLISCRGSFTNTAQIGNRWYNIRTNGVYFVGYIEKILCRSNGFLKR